MKKREFIKKASLAVLGSTFYSSALAKNLSHFSHNDPEKLATEEDFWLKVRQDYKLKPDYINLENGYYNIIPTPTLEALKKNIDLVNYEGSHYMRTVQWDNKDRMVQKVSKIINAKPQNVILTRNTTESLNMVIKGMSWQKGDEAVYAVQDYGAMKNMFDQVSRRFGTVNKIISIPNHPASDEEIVALYEKAFEFDINDLECDYYGTSLHKWLAVPLGTGLLYVADTEIDGLWPLFAEEPTETGDIKRLNHTGTIPVYHDLSIEAAIDYYNVLGGKRKEARLRYLQEYWTSKVRGHKNIVVNTPKESHRACGIANVGIKGMKPHEMAKRLLDEHKVFTVAIDNANVQGCRVTPNVFTTIEELDLFVASLKKMSA